jgi:hypothetical protein
VWAPARERMHVVLDRVSGGRQEETALA